MSDPHYHNVNEHNIMEYMMYSIYEDWNFRRIKTSMIQYYIDTYGVNYRDPAGDTLLHYTCYMTDEQLDLLFGYKPAIFYKSPDLTYDSSIFYGFMTYHRLFKKHTLPRFMRRLIEYDTQHVFVYEFKERLIYEFRILQKNNNVYRPKVISNSIDRAIDIILDEEKRVLSFFDLMKQKHLLNNKKRRF